MGALGKMVETAPLRFTERQLLLCPQNQRNARNGEPAAQAHQSFWGGRGRGKERGLWSGLRRSSTINPPPTLIDLTVSSSDRLVISCIGTEALLLLILCAPSIRRRPFSCRTKMADFEYSRVLSVSSRKTKWHQLRRVHWIWQVATATSINYNVGAPVRAELPYVNINTVAAQSINTERASLRFCTNPCQKEETKKLNLLVEYCLKKSWSFVAWHGTSTLTRIEILSTHCFKKSATC